MKISVIIPTYNRANLISRAVASIPRNECLSKDNSVEIIIIDDGSKDNILEVVENLKRRDSRIIFIKLERNVGVNDARNKGISLATGEWLSFLDSDDEYVEGGLEIIFKTIPSVSKEIEVLGFMTLREVNSVMEPRGYRVGEQWDSFSPSYQDIISKNKIHGDIHYCIRKKVFERGFSFPTGINGFETFFFADMAKNGIKFLYINKLADKRYSGLDGGAHLSEVPYKRWPRQFNKYYKLFLSEHYDILKNNPKLFLDFYYRIAKTYFYTYNPCGIYWLARAWIYKYLNI